jgi:hypothetical protein
MCAVPPAVVFLFTWRCVCVRVSMYVCVRVSMYVCVSEVHCAQSQSSSSPCSTQFVHIYIYIYTFIHIHIHIHIYIYICTHIRKNIAKGQGSTYPPYLMIQAQCTKRHNHNQKKTRYFLPAGPQFSSAPCDPCRITWGVTRKTVCLIVSVTNVSGGLW